MKLCDCFMVLLWLLSAVAADGARGAESEPPVRFVLDPQLGYRAQRGAAVSYEVDFSVVVTAPYKTKLLRVWLPLPPSDAAQQISRRRLETFPQQVAPQIGAEAVYGNQFAYFEFHHPRGGQVIRHRFTAKVWELHWKLDPRQVALVDDWPKEFSPYLRGDDRLRDNAGFRDALRQIAPQRRGSAFDLISAMNWIDRNLTYDHVNASLRADAALAFKTRRGHCSDYHGLCAAMGRALGYPTRVTYGLNLFAKQSPSHCKIEAFLPPYGWVSFDLSETQKMAQRIDEDEKLDVKDKRLLSAAARRRLFGGFRDNTWLLCTRGMNYQLVPSAGRAVPVVRTIYAEADGVPLPDPDPANPQQRQFSWMTVHRYQADRPVEYPFTDFDSLQAVH